MIPSPHSNSIFKFPHAGILGWGTKTSGGEVTPPEVFVCIEEFVEHSQCYKDFQVFVCHGPASAIALDRLGRESARITTAHQLNLSFTAGSVGPRGFCNSEVFVDVTVPLEVFVDSVQNSRFLSIFTPEVFVPHPSTISIIYSFSPVGNGWIWPRFLKEIPNNPQK